MLSRGPKSFTALWPGGHSVDIHIEPDDAVYVNINDVAKIVWAATNYRKSVRTKARNAHDAGELHRMVPMADAIYVPRASVREYLTRFCHRDNSAKRAVQEFDFTSFDARCGVVLSKFAKRHAEEISEKIQRLQRDIQTLEITRHEWDAKAAGWGGAPACPADAADNGAPVEPGEADDRWLEALLE